ncbi:MAG: Trm112 family protein [Acidobacteriota bacterium]|nr:Trm112 family protein [Thermoanaerobaculaceae bacterium]
MAVEKKFLEVLCCPLCRGDLENYKYKDKEYLKCKECKKYFPIEDEIPILLPDAAIKDVKEDKKK